MKRLNKDQLKQRSELIEALRKAQQELGDAIAEANTIIEAKVNAAIDNYNSALGDLETFRDEITGEMETYYDERSDKWRDSDAGSDYDSWKQEWDGLDCSELDQVELIEDPAPSHADDAEALPEEAGGM